MAKFKSSLAQFGITYCSLLWAPPLKMCTQIKGAWSENLYGKWKAFNTWAKVQVIYHHPTSGTRWDGYHGPTSSKPKPFLSSSYSRSLPKVGTLSNAFVKGRVAQIHPIGTTRKANQIYQIIPLLLPQLTYGHLS